MPERAFATQSKRGLDVVMTEEDDVALTRLLRETFSPLEIIGVNFRQQQMQVLESLADSQPHAVIYIMNPDPGEESIERLETALLFCSGGRDDVFRSSLPRRQALYLRSNSIEPMTTKLRGRGQPVEILAEGRFLFTYDRTDPEAHRFTNKMFRLLSKMLVNRFAAVDAETDQFLREHGPTHSFRVGPGALESCRKHPRRYIKVGPMRDEETRLFLAPLPAEAYELQKRRRRPAKA